MRGNEPSPCAQGERRPSLGSVEASSRAQGSDSKSTVLYPQIAGRGVLQGKLPSTQMLSLFPAAPNMEPDWGKSLEC